MSVIKKSSVFAAAFLGLFVSSARADGIVTVNVPFPFVVNHQQFPAGEYEIRNVENTESVVSIEGMNNRATTFALTIPLAGIDPVGNQPALVFEKYEKEYRLTEIWESNTTGREFPGRRSIHDKTARAEPRDALSDGDVYVIAANWK